MAIDLHRDGPGLPCMVRVREGCRQCVGGRPDPTRMIAASVTVTDSEYVLPPGVALKPLCLHSVPQEQKKICLEPTLAKSNSVSDQQSPAGSFISKINSNLAMEGKNPAFVNYKLKMVV